jgi:hypothetical protein
MTTRIIFCPLLIKPPINSHRGKHVLPSRTMKKLSIKYDLGTWFTLLKIKLIPSNLLKNHESKFLVKNIE